MAGVQIIAVPIGDALRQMVADVFQQTLREIVDELIDLDEKLMLYCELDFECKAKIVDIAFECAEIIIRSELEEAIRDVRAAVAEVTEKVRNTLREVASNSVTMHT